MLFSTLEMTANDSTLYVRINFTQLSVDRLRWNIIFRSFYGVYREIGFTIEKNTDRDI